MSLTARPPSRVGSDHGASLGVHPGRSSEPSAAVEPVDDVERGVSEGVREGVAERRARLQREHDLGHRRAREARLEDPEEERDGTAANTARTNGVNASDASAETSSGEEPLDDEPDEHGAAGDEHGQERAAEDRGRACASGRSGGRRRRAPARWPRSVAPVCSTSAAPGESTTSSAFSGQDSQSGRGEASTRTIAVANETR